MTNCRTEQEIWRVLEPRIRIIVQEILDNIEKENKEQIDNIVYGAGVPSDYERSFEFRDKAWLVVPPTSRMSHEVEGQFMYAPLNTGYSEAQHASVVTGEDTREYLAEIIYEGLAGLIFGEGFWTQPRNAWDALLEIIGSKEMEKWIKSGAKKAGLKISIP